MNIKIILIASLSFIFSIKTSSAQSKQDYWWIYGLRTAVNGKVPGYVIDFNQKEFEVYNQDIALNIDSNNASISDKEGNLLFYTNGCAVANAKHEIMINGDSINSGPFIEDFWEPDCTGGYPGVQDVLILPDPANDSAYYLIHKPLSFDLNNTPIAWAQELRYSYIDINRDNGLGEVLEKNITFHDDGSKLLRYYLTAIQHANGLDWWIIQPQDTSNKYLTFLLDKNGFNLIEKQSMGPVFGGNSSASGTAKFSPDGTKYACFNQADGLLLFDFDRSTGKLSNLKMTNVEVEQDMGVFFTSVEWSPNSRFVYLAVKTRLYQVDVTHLDLEDGTILIDEWNGIQDPFSTTFFLMALAPDCKIYMCSTSGTNTYHVIKQPNKKGKACEFIQQGIRLPQSSGFASMPNFPRFRVDESEVCDSTITSIFGQQVFYRKDLKAYPNPASDIVHVDMPDQHSDGVISVYNSEGSLVKNFEVTKNETSRTLDVFNFASGFYQVEFIPRINPNRHIYTAVINVAR